MNPLQFENETRPSRYRRPERQGGSGWLPIIALLLLLQLLLTARVFWFTNWQLDRIDSSVRDLKYR